MSKAGHINPKNENGEAETPHFFGLRLAIGADQPKSKEVLGKPPVSDVHLRSGDLCPQCQNELLDYDGLLNLTCARCGYTPGGGCFS